MLTVCIDLTLTVYFTVLDALFRLQAGSYHLSILFLNLVLKEN